jgi:excisionase family DNA binding protein
VAERLRLGPQTVYRWCRSGRLNAIKLGKEWRITAGQIGQPPTLSGLLPLPTVIRGLIGGREHLLGLAGDHASLMRLEAGFFEAAAAAGARMVYGIWEEEESAILRRLRPVVGAGRRGPAGLRFVEFLPEYEEEGAGRIVRLLLGEAEAALTEGVPCCVYSSSYAYFGYHSNRYASYEHEVHDLLRDTAAVVLCGMALNDVLPAYEGRGVTLCASLANCHTGVVWFDGERALLQRPAAVPRA